MHIALSLQSESEVADGLDSANIIGLKLNALVVARTLEVIIMK